MNTIKCFSLLIAGSFFSTAILAQNTPTTVAVGELDLKPVLAKPTGSNIPAPGTRVEAVEPVDALKSTAQPKTLKMATTPNNFVQPSPTQVTEIMPIKAETEALQIPDVSVKQAKLTAQQKETMTGKAVRPKTIDQSTGATESKLMPAITIKPIEGIKPVLAPDVVEN